MNTQTPIDIAHADMQSDEENATARLGFYERLSDGELFMLLDDDATDETISPRLFPVENQQFALVFDREERLADFAQKTVPYAALSGRAIVAMLAGQGIGLGVNLGVAPSSILIPPDAVNWLAQTLAHKAQEEVEQPTEILAPSDVPQHLLQALDAKLALAGGLAQAAYLVGVRYASGRAGHLLGVVGPLPGAQSPMAQAISEALIFSGQEADSLDVAFFDGADPICKTLSRVGLRFDLPKPEKPATAAPSAPGMDPENPPRLR